MTLIENNRPKSLLNETARKSIEDNPNAVADLQNFMETVGPDKVTAVLVESLEYAKQVHGDSSDNKTDGTESKDVVPDSVISLNTQSSDVVTGEASDKQSISTGNALGAAKDIADKISRKIVENKKDEDNKTAEEVSALAKTDIPPVVADKGLLQYIEGNRLGIKPVKIGEENFYEIKSRGGEILFHVPANSVKLEIMRDAWIDLETDELEIGKLYEITAKVQAVLRRMGLPADQVPVDPGEIAEKIVALSEKFVAVQESRSRIAMQNTFQGLLNAVQKVYEEGDEAMKKYDKKTQRLIGEVMETINIRAMQNMQIDEQTVGVAENVKLIAIEMAQARMAQSGWKRAGNYIQGVLTGASKFVTGNDALVPGVIDVTDAVVTKSKDHVADIVSRTVDGTGKRLSKIGKKGKDETGSQD